MRLSEINPESLSRKQLTRLIFGGIHDDGKNGDCIFVFGGKTSHRVLKAAQLFKNKRAPYILLSGGSSRWDHPKPEAEWMKEHLMAFDIPEACILTECEAANTTENVIGSMMVLQKKFSLHRIKRLLLVSSPYHMRRCELTCRTYMPDWIQYSLCPDNRPYGQSYNWWKAEKERQRVLKEATSLVKYVREGILMDCEMNID
ncbi:YdcF family protein [Tuberibacillus calidus]|uniref:YdcF family protein n=1 Tax=Tuberibacillus calidus TaxID=340097 RepID=UPI0003F59ACF|nr:YdcF family protein [Tuberibacillus calidus]